MLIKIEIQDKSKICEGLSFQISKLFLTRALEVELHEDRIWKPFKEVV